MAGRQDAGGKTAMTDFIYGTEIACPLSLVNEANDLWMWARGYGPGDQETFKVRTDDAGNPDPYLDDNGNPYAVITSRWKKETLAVIASDLTKLPIPDYCYDVDGKLLIDPQAAQLAQDSLALINEDNSQADIVDLISQAGPGYIFVGITGYVPGDVGPDTRIGPIDLTVGGQTITFWIRGVAGQRWIGIDWNGDRVPDIWIQDNGPLSSFDPTTRKVVKEARKL